MENLRTGFKWYTILQEIILEIQIILGGRAAQSFLDVHKTSVPKEIIDIMKKLQVHLNP